MSRFYPLTYVNAFTTRADGGNPACVLIVSDWPAEPKMAQIARELAQPATAFVGPASNRERADFAIRWFSPAQEIALCGHASLAAGHVLLERSGDQSVTLATARSGVITVQRSDLGFEVALPAVATKGARHAQAAKQIGLPSCACFRSELGYNLFVIESEAELRGLRPDFAGLSRLAGDQFIVTAPGDTTDIASRVFKGGEGAGEDAVTGSAHSVLAPYWASRLDRRKMSALQASDRGGELTLRFEDSQIWVGGQCVTVAARTFGV